MSNPTELHWYGTNHTNSDPFRSLFNAAAVEKEDLMSLNNRLADVLMRLERMHRDPSKGGADAAAFLQTIHCLEDEIKKLKGFYDNELSRMRRECEMHLCEKNELQHTANECKNYHETIQLRFDDTLRENTKLNDDIGTLKNYVAQKEREMADVTNCMHGLKTELELLKPKLGKYEQDSENFRRQWECERRLRQEGDDKNQQLVEKLNFETRLHEQHIRDLEDRLANASTIIDCLNQKILELQRSDKGGNLSELLQRIREQMMQEMSKYKHDTEEAVNKALTDMKEQLERKAREKELLAEQRDNLTSVVSHLQGQLNDVQAQLSASCQSNQQLQQLIQMEKVQSTNCIRELEHRIAEQQDQMLLKVREVSAAREVQTALRGEIESFKTIVEREERKLTRACLPAVNTSTGTQNPMYVPQGYPTSTNLQCGSGSNVRVSSATDRNQASSCLKTKCSSLNLHALGTVNKSMINATLRPPPSPAGKVCYVD